MADGQPFYLIVADHDRGVFSAECPGDGRSALACCSSRGSQPPSTN